MVLYAWVIFLGAFLLFQIQPLIAKIILPSFGGSSVVWSTCMLFFQVALLLGYAYAHWLNEHLRATRQAMVHSALLLVSIAVLPIGPDAARSVTGVDHPSWQILKLLCHHYRYSSIFRTVFHQSSDCKPGTCKTAGAKRLIGSTLSRTSRRWRRYLLTLAAGT